MLAFSAPLHSDPEKAHPEAGDSYQEGDPLVYEENAGKSVAGQSIAYIEWSIDGGETWHRGSGEGAEPMPRL